MTGRQYYLLRYRVLVMGGRYSDVQWHVCLVSDDTAEVAQWHGEDRDRVPVDADLALFIRSTLGRPDSRARRRIAT